MRAGQCLSIAMLAVLAGTAWAQGQTPMPAEQIASERASIAQARARINARFAMEEQACHQRFAVNDCLNRNLAWQREELGALRRQEILLNDSERQRKAAERLERLDRKQEGQATDGAGRSTNEPRLPGTAPQPRGGRLPQQGEPAPRVPDQAAIQQHQQRMQDKQQRQVQEQARRAEQAAQGAEEARRHAERVREAEERKQRILQRNAAEPSTAKPLPEPAR